MRQAALWTRLRPLLPPWRPPPSPNPQSSGTAAGSSRQLTQSLLPEKQQRPSWQPCQRLHLPLHRYFACSYVYIVIAGINNTCHSTGTTTTVVVYHQCWYTQQCVLVSQDVAQDVDGSIDTVHYYTVKPPDKVQVLLMFFHMACCQA